MRVGLLSSFYIKRLDILIFSELDFAAHSNYVELALRELGELTIFPHVGVATQGYLHGKYLFPLTTGTFGGVDLVYTIPFFWGGELVSNSGSNMSPCSFTPSSARLPTKSFNPKSSNLKTASVPQPMPRHKMAAKARSSEIS